MAVLYSGVASVEQVSRTNCNMCRTRSQPAFTVICVEQGHSLQRTAVLHHRCQLALLLRLQGPNSKIAAQLLGLSVKAQTRLLEDAAAAAAVTQQSSAHTVTGQQQAHAAQDQSMQAVPVQQQQQQQVATSILEPCDVHVTMKSDEAVQDMNVDVSALQLRMSPDVLQLLMHLQQVGVVVVLASRHQHQCEAPQASYHARP